MSSTPLPLAGRVAVVCGGSGGIGAASARLLAGAGAAVVVGYHGNRAKAEAVAAGLPGTGHRALAAPMTDSAGLARLAQALDRADILVNAAGMTRPVPHGDLDGLTDELIDEVFRVNWRGPFAAIRALRPLLAASGDGLVVNVSSIAATTGVGSSIAYCGAKAGLDIMSVALARALAPRIRVLVVAPGVVDTDFVAGRTAEQNAKIAAGTPLQRVASTDEVARAVLACATHLTFSTGSIVQVDGGRHL
jgi:NAD(P)-dependent dehydrogenase (short-subunit alcohol dehydrogenase family)